MTGGEDGADQGAGHRLWAAAGAGSRRDGGVPHPFRHGQGRPHQERALHARHRSLAPPPRHREGRARLRRHRLAGRERGGFGARGEGAGRIGGRGDRRARRRPARAAQGAQRLPDRGGARHREGRADRGHPPGDQQRRRDAPPQGRALPPQARPLDSAAHRPRRHGDAQAARDRAVVPRHAGSSSAPTTSMSAARTTSSARSTAATAARSMSTTTSSSASPTARPASTTCPSRSRTSTTSSPATTT